MGNLERLSKLKELVKQINAGHYNNPQVLAGLEAVVLLAEAYIEDAETLGDSVG